MPGKHEALNPWAPSSAQQKPTVHRPVVLALSRWREEDLTVFLNYTEFEASLGYMRLCLKHINKPLKLVTDVFLLLLERSKEMGELEGGVQKSQKL